MKPRSLSLTAIHALRLLDGSWRDGRQRLAFADEGPDGEGPVLIFLYMRDQARQFFTVPHVVFALLKRERYVAVAQVGAWQAESAADPVRVRRISYQITEVGQRALTHAIAPQKVY